jgi:uncharacterized protein (TIGR04255 family)
VCNLVPGTAHSPASGPIPATIPLNPPPLATVLVQVRFAHVAAVVSEEFFASFQQDLLAEYPLSVKEQEVVLALGPDATPRSNDLWRMHDENEQWRLTLATSFVALETSAYPGKEEFFARLQVVLDAVQHRIRPPRVERLGVRYVCRIEDESDLARLDQLIRPEVLGVASLEERPELAITQSQFALDGATLMARWGLLPPKLVIDPTLHPLDRRSWLLDVDVFSETKREFDADVLTEDALGYSRLQYRFFRWAVEPSSLLRFGANPELVAAAEATP